jgi:hypothetical protein
MLFFARVLVPAKAIQEELPSPYRLRWLDHYPFKIVDRDRRPVGTPI